MELGISVATGMAGQPGEVAATIVARARIAGEVGLGHLSFGAHHAVGPNAQQFQGVPVLGRALADWPSPRPAGLLFLVPVWHPVMMAEMIGTLAALHDGPFIVQTGLGSGGHMFDALGVDPSQRGRLADATIPLVKALLAGETVSDERFGISNAAIGPRPEHRVEWWIGAGSAPSALDRVARHGDAWYFGPSSTPGDAIPIIELYHQRCEHHGTTSRLIMRADVIVGDNDAAAVALGDKLFADGYRGMPREAIVAGGVDRVATRLAPWANIGVTDVVARNATVPFEVAEHSTELLGTVRTQLL